METCTLHANASCHGNPGPGGYAAIVPIPSQDPIVLNGGHPVTTADRMELTAVVQGLEQLLRGVHFHNVEVRTRSQYVFSNFNQIVQYRQIGWLNSENQPVLNRDLWEKLFHINKRTPVTLTLVTEYDPKTEFLMQMANKAANTAASAEKPWSNIIHGLVGGPDIIAPLSEPLPQRPEDQGGYRTGYAAGHRDGYEAALAQR